MKHIKRNKWHIVHWVGIGVVATVLTYMFRRKKELNTQTIVAGTRG